MEKRKIEQPLPLITQKLMGPEPGIKPIKMPEKTILIPSNSKPLEKFKEELPELDKCLTNCNSFFDHHGVELFINLHYNFSYIPYD